MKLWLPVKYLLTTAFVVLFSMFVFAAVTQAAAVPAWCVPQSNPKQTTVDCTSIPNLTNANQLISGHCYFYAPISGSTGQTATETDCSALPGYQAIPNQEKSANVNQSQITTLYNSYINPLIKFLSAGVGIVVTIMLVISGIQYTTAGSDPQAVNAAKSRAFNAVIALVAFALLFAFLQWVVPGGIK